MTERPKHFPALTGLRFFLALWVVFHHLTGPGQSMAQTAAALPGPLHALIRGGYLAVTTFFVLSGFVLARSYPVQQWTTRRVLDYASGRLARVYPVYVLSLAAIAPFVIADRTPDKPAYIAHYAALLQGWFPRDPVGWNTPAWSLSCEIFFYLTFPLAASWLARADWRKTVAAATIAMFLTRAFWAAGVPDEIKPLIHFADFLMGIAAARAYDLIEADGRRLRGWWLYLPATTLAALLIAWPQLLPPSLDLNTALRPLNGVMLIGLALGGGIVARGLSIKPAVFLGKASYAMYILHVPVLWWFMRWTREFSAAAYVAVVLSVSALVYRFLEEPANRYLRSRARSALQA